MTLLGVNNPEQLIFIVSFASRSPEAFEAHKAAWTLHEWMDSFVCSLRVWCVWCDMSGERSDRAMQKETLRNAVYVLSQIYRLGLTSYLFS